MILWNRLRSYFPASQHAVPAPNQNIENNPMQSSGRQHHPHAAMQHTPRTAAPGAKRPAKRPGQICSRIVRRKTFQRIALPY
jgi:hypothetical protein